ncbi:MAG: phytanoyl-CoA dioxygenase family protein [Chloroflexota bacterium]|nr:phytanoyl-CoA dioxygenase family protein [Chloroflexota bacterium]
MTQTTPLDLTSHYPITPDHLAFFRANGYIKLKQVLAPEVLTHYGAEITRMVRELNTLHLPMEERSTYQKAFLQVMNLFEHSETVRAFVFSARLAQIAADLLEVEGVRLYHDQALYKEAGGGITPWHADQFYWPLETDRTATVWIPLQATPMELGPLAFAAGTQQVDLGRSLGISDESEKYIADQVASGGFTVDEAPFDLGEVSYHMGWTFHRAGANQSDRARAVMTMIYIDADMRVMQPKNANQEADLRDWIPGILPGAIAASARNPLLYTRRVE